MKKIIVISLLISVLVLIIGCTPEPQSFDKNKALAQSKAASVPTLEKDYDTADLQVRHLSWGKLNYYPETITVKANKKVQIIGDTTRLQGCFRSISIPKFNVNGQFREGNNIIEFTPAETGTFGFGCAMGMGRGTLVVG